MKWIVREKCISRKCNGGECGILQNINLVHIELRTVKKLQVFKHLQKEIKDEAKMKPRGKNVDASMHNVFVVTICSAGNHVVFNRSRSSRFTVSTPVTLDEPITCFDFKLSVIT